MPNFIFMLRSSLSGYHLCIFIIVLDKLSMGGLNKTKFVHAQIKLGVTEKSVHTHKDQDKTLCDSGIGITWVHVSRLPIAAPRQCQMEMHLVH